MCVFACLHMSVDSCGLNLDLVTLILDLDLNHLKVYLNTKPRFVVMPFRS